MAYVNHNGKQIWVPDAVSSNDLEKIVNPTKKPGRRPAVRSGTKTTPLEKNKVYTAKDLTDTKGRPVNLVDIPDRTKGGWLTDLVKVLFDEPVTPVRPKPNPQANRNYQPTQRQPTQVAVPMKNTTELFWGNRTALSKRIIIEQCESVSQNFFKGDCEIDYEGAHTFKVNKFILPPKWRRMPGVVDGATPLTIVFPTEYPKVAPIGFYLIAAIVDKNEKGHLYTSAYHDADKVMVSQGWKWYCVYLNEGSWQPSVYRRPNDWRDGDNLWTYFHLIQEVLTSND